MQKSPRDIYTYTRAQTKACNLALTLLEGEVYFHFGEKVSLKNALNCLDSRRNMTGRKSYTFL